MTRADVKKHQNAKLTLTILDRYTGAPQYNAMSQAEISTATGIPRKTVSKIEIDALAKLRKDPEIMALLLGVLPRSGH